MADIINIRITKDCPEVSLMDETAQALGMSRNEMIIKAITMMVNFDRTFYKRLEKYSENLKVPMWLAIQNTMVKKWAESSAKKNAWENNSEILLEYSCTEDGFIQPKELYEMVYKITFEAETKERFKQLSEDLNKGMKLSAADQEFYNEFKPKYGYIPRLERESFDISETYWESDLKGRE